mmetsp:Transcript_31010/g.45846  ORF Transcript_31010/g.45846 Transcript_31010/m.45846 type:complete len:344 (-) Transcript_31010:84-1115(-)
MALTERHLYECDLHPLSLRSDLDRYPTISLEDVNRAEDLYGDHARRLVIKNNALYGRDGAENAIVGVSSFVEEMLLLMLKRVKVPDVDFVLNCSDFPQVWKDGHRYSRQDAPVVSMCGSTEHNDIIVPTYELALAVQGRTISRRTPSRFAWAQRKNQMVWRGSDSNRDRFTFNKLANSAHFTETGLFDVGISQMVRVKHDLELHGPVKEGIPRLHFGDYKWIANIDGAVAAYRMPIVAALGSTIVKQETKYFEHWYREFIPWKHYVPMADDFSDLDEILKWLTTHDTEAQRIGEAGRQFALDNLQPNHVQCFWYSFLYEYAARMTYEPQILEGMVKSGDTPLD